MILTSIAILCIKNHNHHDLLNRLKFLLLINFFVLIIPASQLNLYLAKNGNIKVWDNTLRWSDFKGETYGDTDIYAANIHTGFFYRYNEVFNFPRVISITLMDRDKSWASAVFAKYNTNELLNHEKIHFDISEWSPREFQDSIRTLKRISKSKVKNVALYFQNLNDKRQFEYDSVTNHGANYTLQQEWNEKINQIINN